MPSSRPWYYRLDDQVIWQQGPSVDSYVLNFGNIEKVQRAGFTSHKLVQQWFSMKNVLGLYPSEDEQTRIGGVMEELSATRDYGIVFGNDSQTMFAAFLLILETYLKAESRETLPLIDGRT